MKYIVAKVEDWDQVAQALAKELRPGMILALTGPLGAGKTTFVQALSRVLGAKGNPRSPTFSLVRSYAVKAGEIKTLVHVDAYRIEDERDVLPLGLDEYLSEPGTVVAIEWSERVANFIRATKAPVLSVTIDPDPSGVRRVDVR
ncbi:tRNA (adenosine(37)-N6)-threonylcarbamoyltransferase complex ATPase subunit type 1 TsaE [Patescibacteria group bacterium]|nr:tRNA (adenosine(37)-N6)-threonylcarbamoyltransferase complex ATPase subunit type 1 TsaE [Patescibacteria group bacterium]